MHGAHDCSLAGSGYAQNQSPGIGHVATFVVRIGTPPQLVTFPNASHAMKERHRQQHNGEPPDKYVPVHADEAEAVNREKYDGQHARQNDREEGIEAIDLIE